MPLIRCLVGLVCGCLAGSPLAADTLQSRTEQAYASAPSESRRAKAVDQAIQEGLSLEPGWSLARYLEAVQAAETRLGPAWAACRQDLAGRGDPDRLRQAFLQQVGFPLAEAHLALARLAQDRSRTAGGLGLELPPAFREDLDRAIGLKNAALLQARLRAHLAGADLDLEARNPAAAYRGLLLGLLKAGCGYTIRDFQDIFSYQAPGATPDQLDEDVFSLYRTLKDQTAATAALLRLLEEILPADVPLETGHAAASRWLADLAFGPASGPTPAGPAPAALAQARRATSGWALRQGLLRTLCFGEHLAHRYAQELQDPHGRAGLSQLQPTRRATPAP